MAEAELRDRINERWMRRGVTMWDPERTYVDAGSHLEADVSLLPGVILRGTCTVGAGAEIGPNAVLTDTVVGQGAIVRESVCTQAVIGERAQIGPYSVLEAGGGGRARRRGAAALVRRGARGVDPRRVRAPKRARDGRGRCALALAVWS